VLSVAVVSRYFTTFDPVPQAHATMQSPRVITGDFDIYFDFTASATSGRVLGNAASSNNDISPSSDRLGLNFKFAGGSSKFLAYDFTLSAGKLYRVGLHRSSGIVRVSIGGIMQASSQTDSGVLTVDVIGRSGSLYHNGVIANVTLTDLATPSNSESWKLDKPIGTNTEQSSSGNNLLTYVNATKRELFTKVGNDWLGAETLSTTAMQWTSTAAYETVIIPSVTSLSTSARYKVKLSVGTAPSGSSVRYRAFETYLAAGESASTIETPSLSTHYIQSGINTGSYSVSGMSIRRILEAS
jgi:hypothetical protein